LVAVPKVGPQLSSALLKNEKIENSLIKDKVGSHLLEKLILHSNDSIYKHLYKDFFRENLLEYSAHQVANFVVQKMIVACKKERYFKEMLQVLKPKIYDYLFKENRSGIVIALLESALQFPSCQGELCHLILDAFGCTSDQSDLVSIILHFKPREQYEKRIQVHSPHLQGSLVLQHLIRYSQPHSTPFIMSVIALEVSKLILWIQDPIASRVVENCVQNETTPNKLKKQLIEAFSGYFLKLATDKYASRFVDKCWQAATIEVKVQRSHVGKNSRRIIKTQANVVESFPWKVCVSQLPFGFIPPSQRRMVTIL
jgi:nucleolar protein 9